MREDGNTEDELYIDLDKREGTAPFLIVASDGACPNQQYDSRLCRAGAGLYYGEGHAMNEAWKVNTYAQSAQRGEVHAALRWVQGAWVDTQLWTDSKLVVLGVKRIINGSPHNMKDHTDLWDSIREGIKAKHHITFRVKK